MIILILVVAVLYVAVLGWKLANVMDEFGNTYNETGKDKKSIHSEVKNERNRNKIRSKFKGSRE